ncbi:MAG TPA: 4a-hydroxytetrahydrobiopterin dehydratase [Candidatus Sulfotelmatobacter sp.]|nr:4a-hydroxytetrahydrobiopterin dehydratase [Candidatus Sulfotelmatobacter sp.]
MTSPRLKLSDSEIASALKTIPGWSVEGGKLHRRYQFADFIEAWGFMSSAALVAQQMDHHPEWSNVYHTVTVDLVTHDLKGISTRDVELATRMEALASR